MKTKIASLSLSAFLASTLYVSAQVEPVTIEVVDANDTVVGTSVTIKGPAEVLAPINVDGHVILAQIGPTVLFAGMVFFTTSDCSGQAYVPSGPLSLPNTLTNENYAIVGPRFSVYVGPLLPLKLSPSTAPWEICLLALLAIKRRRAPLTDLQFSFCATYSRPFSRPSVFAPYRDDNAG